MERSWAPANVYASTTPCAFSRPAPCPATRPGLRSLDEGFVPEILDSAALDGRYLVTTEESILAMRRLATTEGIFAGVSSGGVLAVASRVAATMDAGTLVALLADGGWKYLSEDLWRSDPDEDALESLNLW